MIITKSSVTAAAAAAAAATTRTTTTTTTTTAARWPLLQNRETLGRIYHNVDGKRRSTTKLHSDAVSAMLSRNCGRRNVVHGNDNSNIIEPRWISDSCTEIVSVLPYYYYCQRLAIISIVASLLADDDIRGDNLIESGRLSEHRDDAGTDDSAATSSDDLRILNRRDGLLRCCA
ncbi:hypothetical protein ALC56_04385 [Trachymyrmex septentrionalis]|uniref:Uncharacterized protein n=1 Tax=Trachymyrmex septentrionalis TaxID=34720 RepID=A0A195FMT0_9HYME|nr:PREDICTED: uncharacterized protein LOC108746821 [Trachymyrmex septentrionalis]KYN41234.1 hypothetical protein ALC56_04385 [Trachymyrmex septentrionalis]